MQSNFEKWLVLSTTSAEKTIKNYIGAISRIDDDLAKTNIVQSSLEEIDSAEELEQIKNDYFSIPAYKALNARGHGMYSAAFNMFISYKRSEDSKEIGNSNKGIVYIISNQGMPGLVKIGQTSNLEQRIGSLNRSSAVPYPFRCVIAKKVDDYKVVEKRLHKGLKSHRVNPKREFFKIAEEEAKELLDIVKGENVTPNEDTVIAFENRLED